VNYGLKNQQLAYLPALEIQKIRHCLKPFEWARGWIDLRKLISWKCPQGLGTWLSSAKLWKLGLFSEVVWP